MMPRDFFHATAEQTVAATEAVQVNGKSSSAFVERFCDFPGPQTTDALHLGVDLGLLRKNGTDFETASPLARLLTAPDEKQKAAVLRIVLESYEPFVLFRDRLISTGSADTAANQTKTLLDLNAHREDIKDTLISLGTYSSAIRALGGGRYSREDAAMPNQLFEAAKACSDAAASEARIREEIGAGANIVSREDVLRPLASALLKASSGDPEDAVTEASKAVESYIAELASRMTVVLTGATGINQKLDRFRTKPDLPKKIVEAAKYLGQVRNAADHGLDTDPDVQSVWKIQRSTAINYIYVACAFIAACTEREKRGAFVI